MPRKKTVKTEEAIPLEKKPIRVAAQKTPPVAVKKKNNKRLALITVFGILFVLVAFVAFSFWWQSNVAKQNFSSSQDELQTIISRISQFMDLPLGETPTLATVLDQDKLNNQPFFALP